MKKILVVCGANLGRSQSLMHYLQEFARDAGKKVVVKSAGIRVDYINQIRRENAAVFPLNERMIRTSDILRKGHSSRTAQAAEPINEELVNWADLIISVTPEISEFLAKRFPKFAGKVRLAKELAAGKPLPKTAGFKDPYTLGKAKRYRRGARQQAALDKPEPKAFWLMNKEAQNIARKIIRRI